MIETHQRVSFFFFVITEEMKQSMSKLKAERDALQGWSRFIAEQHAND